MKQQNAQNGGAHSAQYVRGYVSPFASILKNFVAGFWHPVSHSQSQLVFSHLKQKFILSDGKIQIFPVATLRGKLIY